MKEHKQKWERQLFYLQEHNKRYGLIVPPSNQGLPFVAEIPDLPKPTFKEWLPPKPELTPEERQFQEDLAYVQAREDQITYNKYGHASERGIGRILGIDYGPQFHRAVKVAEWYNRHLRLP